MTRAFQYIVLPLYFTFIFFTFNNSAVGNDEEFVSHSEKVLAKIIKNSNCVRQKRSLSQMLDCVRYSFKGIFPGTLWCGPGNISKHPNDLGYFKKADSCCREHDHCYDTIEPGDSKYGLKNKGYFTRSHCSCDSKFHKCLTKARTVVSTKLGYTYFNILQPQCFEKQHPATCAKHSNSKFFQKKCTDYSFDKSQNQEWQWFDNPDFKSLYRLFGKDPYSLES